ncbi:type I secretion system permease/ATPase [Thioclava sp.]|uniref:type I secretion system permease/ATPase n=1 Tax=Thioclava sp. TaxID=1933450 RepID=UPI003AA7F039
MRADLMQIRQGRAEIEAVRRASRAARISAGLFSAFVNLLMLTGPLFMLQVYDRVLGSRAVETLTALFLLVCFLYLMMGMLDWARGRVMARVGSGLQQRLEARVFKAALRRASDKPGDTIALTAMRDLEAMQKYYAAPVAMALYDMPFVPIFFAILFLFNTWLGVLALAGGMVLVVITLLNTRLTRVPMRNATARQVTADRMADQMRDEAELVQALGMRMSSFQRWQQRREQAMAAQLNAADLGGSFQATGRVFRLFLQSAILALGALLVLRGELTAGAMIAGSILMGRALAPIETAIAGLPIYNRAKEGRERLEQLLGAHPEVETITDLPRPAAHLEAHQLTVIPPGHTQATLRLVSFDLQPGQAMGVIGPSGAGKSTLARAICGVWQPNAGWIRLDGATLDQYDPDRRGRMIGYLPQRVTLFDGTIAENISRLDAAPDSEKVVEAAKRAGAHQMILDLPKGYDTPVNQSGGLLSGGQIQRVGLARAIYDDPVLLVLDEPNANLDSEGARALNAAVHDTKARGGAVVIMAHRPAAIQECDTLLMLEGGRRRAYGPRDEVLRAMVKNAENIQRVPGQGGVV